MRVLLRLTFLSAAVFSLTITMQPMGDDQSAEALALLTHARQLQDLRTEGSPAFQLRAQVIEMLAKKETPGGYGVTWRSPDHWREELRIGDFGRLRVGTEGGYWQLRSVEYQSQTIFALDQMLDIVKLLWLEPSQTAAKPKLRRISGNSLSCFEVRAKGHVVRELCFDPTLGVLVHAEVPVDAPRGAKDRMTIDYSDVRPFGDRLVPHNIRLDRPGRFKLQISFTSLEPVANIAAAIFEEPAHSEFWGDCRAGSPSETITRKMPDYPRLERQEHQDGFVSVYLRIEPDGSASHLVILGSNSSAFATAARMALQQWRFKPRTCGGSPVRDETVIDVVFWTNQ